MKNRPLGTTAYAVTRIKDAIGPERCARVVDRSVSTVYKWCDPDGTNAPSLQQAFLLDLEFVRAGLGEPPILSVYAHRLADDLDRRPAAALQLVPTVLSLQDSIGKLASLIAQLHDNSPERENELSPRDLYDMAEILGKLDADVDGLQERLRRRVSVS